MSDDMSFRSWICKNCGQRILSKSPSQRKIFPSLQDFIVTIMSSRSLVRIVDDPARPKGEEMRHIQTNEISERARNGKDLEIRITVYDDKFSWTPEEDIETPKEALIQYLKHIREMTEEQVKFYVCNMLHDHLWVEAKDTNNHDHQS